MFASSQIISGSKLVPGYCL